MYEKSQNHVQIYGFILGLLSLKFYWRHFDLTVHSRVKGTLNGFIFYYY